MPWVAAALQQHHGRYAKVCKGPELWSWWNDGWRMVKMEYSRNLAVAVTYVGLMWQGCCNRYGQASRGQGLEAYFSASGRMLLM